MNWRFQIQTYPMEYMTLKSRDQTSLFATLVERMVLSIKVRMDVWLLVTLFFAALITQKMREMNHGQVYGALI